MAGTGNDTINQSAADAGRDLVNGGVGIDTYVLTGTADAEDFQVLTRAAAQTAGFSDLHSQTEIVITRGGSIIAELDNIEEITVNTLNTTVNDGNGAVNGGSNGGDNITVIGDFTVTSLDYSTIRVNGGAGTDTVDISGLDSAHRLVFTTNGGSDQVIGELRPQDVVDGAGTSGTFAHILGSPDLHSISRMDLADRGDGADWHIPDHRMVQWESSVGLHLWGGQQDLF